MKNLTDITFIIDRSGSMSSIKDDVIGGFNTTVREQRKVEGAAHVSLVQFDNEYEVVHNCVKLADVPNLTSETFIPRGSTALLDAIGKTLGATTERIAKTSKRSRPEKVIFVILTDGHENASVEYTRNKVFELISEAKKEKGWEFVFIGANQDAIAEGNSYGIGAASSLTFGANAQGTTAVCAALNASLSSYRSGPHEGEFVFSDEQRKEVEKSLKGNDSD